MPFQSKAQLGAAFGGYLGPEMKTKASKWAHETPNISALPEHKRPVPPRYRTRKQQTRFSGGRSGGRS